MNTSAAYAIKNGLAARREEIPFSTTEDPQAVIRQAFALDPALVCFVDAYGVGGSGGRYTFRVKYRQTDIAREDIVIVTSREEGLDRMCHFAGEYKKQITLVASDGVNIENIQKDFHERFVTFYPSIEGYGSEGYHSTFGYVVWTVSFRYRIGSVKLRMMERQVKEEVDRVSRMLFIPGLPEEVKIYLAHNYLASTVTYKREEDKNRLDVSYTQSAYGALILKKCVCQGFAEAFKRLMDVAGVACDTVFGTVTGPDGGLHAWNIIHSKKDGCCYHVDTTWDAAGDKPLYRFFCVDDASISCDRRWNREYNCPCRGKSDLLTPAKAYVLRNKPSLLAGGIPEFVLDC